MSRKIKLFSILAFSALLLTMCRVYAQSEPVPSTSIEGLSCRAYTGGLECYYECPNGTEGPLDFEEDPSLSASKGDLDRLYCGIAAPQFTPTDPAASMSPTPVASETPAVSATPEATATSQASPTPEQPLLTGQTTMCDLGSNLVSFRMVEPLTDLTDKALTVEIADTETNCSVNPTNPSLLTCTIPPLVIFPASVVVRLDDAVVNDFTYEGIGCEQLTTPVATTTP